MSNISIKLPVADVTEERLGKINIVLKENERGGGLSHNYTAQYCSHREASRHGDKVMECYANFPPSPSSSLWHTDSLKKMEQLESPNQSFIIKNPFFILHSFPVGHRDGRVWQCSVYVCDTRNRTEVCGVSDDQQWGAFSCRLSWAWLGNVRYIVGNEKTISYKDWNRIPTKPRPKNVRKYEQGIQNSFDNFWTKPRNSTW